MNHRQKLIIEKLSIEEFLNISALAKELSVLKMTIHRDLDALQRAGLTLKQHGKVYATARLRGEDPLHCQMCSRNLTAQNLFTLISQEGRKNYYCCPHCGLLAYGYREAVWQCLATDFLHGHTVSAAQAYYLIEPDLKVCCSPSVLAFASEEEAKRFQMGFGGRIKTMLAAIYFLNRDNVGMKNSYSTQGKFNEGP